MDAIATTSPSFGDRYRVLGACLAVSDCAVSFDRVDDRDLALATTAMELLIATLGELAENTELAEEVDWSATGHDALEMFATLDRWKKRLQEAAKLNPDGSLSAKELWERIGR